LVANGIREVFGVVMIFKEIEPFIAPRDKGLGALSRSPTERLDAPDDRVALMPPTGRVAPFAEP
jgi:hypothetical protein